MTRTVICNYCDDQAELVTGKEIYPHIPSLNDKRFWRCFPCGAYVGTHSNSKDHAPLGKLANKELRQARLKAHAKFDPMWKTWKGKYKYSRTDAYSWLAKRLGISRNECHIAMFDAEMCKRVVEICYR